MLEWIIIGILILIIVVLFFKKPKEKIVEKVIEKKIKLDESDIEEWQKRKDRVREEYYNLEKELEKTHKSQVLENTQKLTEMNCNYENAVSGKQIELNHFEEVEKNKILTKLEKENERLRQEKIKEFATLCEQQDSRYEEYDKEIEELKNDLTRLTSMRAAAIEGFKKEEELKNQKAFYSIEFSDNDIEDIHELSKIKLNNRETINKLIFEVYYRNPLNSMLNRVIGKDKVCGVYKITNVESNKAYIGKSTNIKKRWTEHVKSSLDIGTIAKQNIHTAIKKEGIEKFTFQIVEICPKEEYSDREKYWVNFHQTQIFGYNMREGG